MYCTNCGNLVNDSVRFCEKCGIEIQAEKIEEKKDKDKGSQNDKTEKRSKTKQGQTWLVIIVVIVVSIPILGFVIPIVLSLMPASSSIEEMSGYTKQEKITSAVAYAKQQYTLPTKIDNVTTLVNITEESNAIRYHYILSDVNTASISNSSIKKTLLPALCAEKDITDGILGQGINMEYSYSVKGSSKTYFVIITESDCL